MTRPQRGRFVSVGWVRTDVFCDFSTYKPPYLRNGTRHDQGYYWTLWKPHKRFRLVPKSTTLVDIELTVNGHYAFFTLYICLSEPTTKIWMNIDPYYQQQKCRPKIAVSSSVRSLTGVRWGWASNEGGVSFFGDFRPICRNISKTVHSRHKVTI